jgi:nitrogen fixation-related uncharacterized protein
MRKVLLLVFFAIAAIATGVAISLWRVKSEQAQKLDAINKEILLFNAQKDSLTRDLNDATKFISDVYVQVSAISGEVAISNSMEKIDNLDYKAQIASKLQKINTLVDGYRGQMQSAEQRIALLKRQNMAFAEQIKALEETVVRLKDIIQSQQAHIAKLNDDLELTKAERDRYKREALQTAQALIERNQALLATKQKLSETSTQLSETTLRLNTAYYITGTVNDLSAKGIIEKKGGVLFLGGSWQPVQGLADSVNLVAQFNKIDITQTSSIPLPFQSYKIVSAHNPNLTKIEVGEVGVSPFQLRISKPDKFWAQSKFLIVVEW